MPANEVGKLFDYILHSPVRIRNLSGASYTCPLVDSGKHLAHLYLLGSSQTKIFSQQAFPKWWVQPCQPILFLTQDDFYASFDIPLPGRSVTLGDRIPGNLSHHFVPASNGRMVRLWCYKENLAVRGDRLIWDDTQPKYHETKAGANARKLRIFLLRLHAERECLKQILRHISQGNISTTRNTTESENLQYYLNEATRRISRLEFHSNKLTESTVGELAREVEQLIMPGENDSIIAALNTLNIRRNILSKVDEFLRKETTVIMGDQYNVSGQAGAVGPNAHAHDMTFNQIWNQNASDIDLDELVKELSVLRKQLKIEATEPEHDSAVGAIASAEAAAKNGDGAKALEHLATAGKWVLDVAQKLAIPVAIAALKSALGL